MGDGESLNYSTLTGISAGSFSFEADDRLSTETYDINGSVTNTGGKTSAYDSEDRLVSMNTGAVVLRYDGDGNRMVLEEIHELA